MIRTRVLSLTLLVYLSASSSGCVFWIADKIAAAQLDSLEAGLNTWLGKSKDERMTRKGPPDKCAALSTGGEVCEWSVQGVSNASVNCSWDYVHGGQQCHGGGGGSWEHRVVHIPRRHCDTMELPGQFGAAV